MLRLPGWLAFLIFVPLQIFLAIKLYGSYGFWATFGILIFIGILATRAARAQVLRALFFPHAAVRHENRRHIFQGILFLLAAVSYLLVATPQTWVGDGFHDWLERGHPWVPLALLVSLIKATLR